MRMRRIILPSASCPALPYFPTLCHMRSPFLFRKKKIIDHIVCVLIFSTNFVWDISHSKQNSARFQDSAAVRFCGALIVSFGTVCGVPFLCFVDRASLYNLVNKAKLVNNLFLAYLCLSISTCFGRLCAHHQEKQLCLCDTRYLLFCVDDCLVCRSICSCISDNMLLHIRHSSGVASSDDGHIVDRNM